MIWLYLFKKLKSNSNPALIFATIKATLSTVSFLDRNVNSDFINKYIPVADCKGGSTFSQKFAITLSDRMS